MISLYALTIFVSEFLLFLVQPIIAKQILPWFGGSAAVWATCPVFSQCMLLAGYFYVDCIYPASDDKASGGPAPGTRRHCLAVAADHPGHFVEAGR